MPVVASEASLEGSAQVAAPEVPSAPVDPQSLPAASVASAAVKTKDAPHVDPDAFFGGFEESLVVMQKEVSSWKNDVIDSDRCGTPGIIIA